MARSHQRIVLELPTAMTVDGDAEQTAYYVFLEAVTNAQKHAPDATVGVRVGVHGHGIDVCGSSSGKIAVQKL